MNKANLKGIQEDMEETLKEMREVQKTTLIKDEDTRLLAIAITHLETSLLYLKEAISKVKE